MKKLIVIHPFLFAVFPVLFIYLHNIGQTPQNEIYIPILSMILFTSFLWLIFEIFARDIKKTGIILSAFLLLFFSYGHFFNVANSVLSVKNSALKHTYLLSVWFTLFLLFAYFIIRTHRNLNNFTKILNIVASFMIITQVIAILVINIVYWKNNNIVVAKKTDNVDLGKTTNKYPNIYYIILDGYARADMLKDIYHYDNTEFLSYLTKRGFYIANKSAANYNQTTLSLASSLNFDYLGVLENKIGITSDNRKPLLRMINNSRAIELLMKHGYKIINFSSGYYLTEIKNADIYIHPRWNSGEFQSQLLNTTVIPYVFELMRIEMPQYNSHRAWILKTFDSVAKTPEFKTPVFVFAHIFSPHPPFVFDWNGQKIRNFRKFTISDGSHLMQEGFSRNKYIERYRNQLIFINTKVKSLIEHILAKSDKPLIIILQSDHGPGSMLDWESFGKTNLKEKMSILNAYYFSDSEYAELYENISPVNTFRVIFNHFFGTNYEILPDKSYFAPWSNPYKFIEVAERSR